MPQLTPGQQFEDLKVRVASTLKSVLSVDRGDTRVVVHGVEVDDDKGQGDLRGQKEALLGGKDWVVPVYADISVEKDGKELDRRRVKVMDLPKTTDRYGYILGGPGGSTEYQALNQFRQKSGVYHLVKDDGRIIADFNLRNRDQFVRGKPFDIEFDPETALFKFNIRSSKIPAYHLFKAAGISDADLLHAWGPEILEKNQKAETAKRTYVRFAGAASDPDRGQMVDPEQVPVVFKQLLAKTELLPETTERTLGKAYKSVEPDTLLRSTSALLGISRGKREADDRHALEFMEIHSIEDLLDERLRRASPAIQRKILARLDSQKRKSVRGVIPDDLVQREVRAFFNSSLATVTKQINPLEMINGQLRTTIMGEQGGIKSSHAITEESKLINPSHLGFLDPIHTPESEKTGVVLSLPLGVRKKGNDLAAHYRDARTGARVELTPRQVADAVVAFPDQYAATKTGMKPLGKRIKATRGGEVVWVDRKQVDYVLPSPRGIFDVATNLVPFLQNNQGNRAMTASRQQEQAVPLVHREAPLVQVRTDTEKTFEEILGKAASRHSPVDGTVSVVKKDAVIVKDSKGKEHEVQVYRDFPLAGHTLYDSEVKVKAGDKVKAGQLVADTTFTRGGVLSLGTNLYTAYVPMRGLNFEDGIVISESAALKLTSAHAYRKDVKETPDTVVSKRTYIAHAGSDFTTKQVASVDDGGLVKPGTVVHEGDPLVLMMRRPTKEQVSLFAPLRRGKALKLKPAATTWDSPYPGIVTDVVRGAEGQITVYVKTEEPAQVGDKLVGRHGNKGIITCHDEETEVLTDKGWLRFAALTGIEQVCTLNPETRKIEYHVPDHLIRYPYNGRMYRYKGRRLDLCTTPEHRHFVRTRRGEYVLEAAEDCYGKPRLHLRTGSWAGADIDRVEIPGKPHEGKQHFSFSEPASYDADDFLEFFGYWVTEGCLDKSHVIIGQSVTVNPGTYEAICAVVERLGYSYHRSGTSVVLSDPRLAAWLQQFGKAKDKFIFRKFLDASPRQLRILADAVFAGDGGVYFREKDNHTRHEMFTSSKQLADDYQELALKLGVSANVRPQYRDGSIEYVVRWTLKDEVWTNNDNRYENESWIDYDGEVFCVQVKNHVVYVRRNGIPVWSGNCIFPDEKMPYKVDPKTKEKKHVQIALNPLGVPGRINLGQVLETVAGKIAEKEGKPYNVRNFEPRKDYLKDVASDLKKAGLTDKETLIDPRTGQAFEQQVLAGNQYILKLEHQVGKKISARSGGPGMPYNINYAPTGGPPSPGMSMGELGLYALLAHGARENIHEMYAYKGNKITGSLGNDPFWDALRDGSPIPPPKTPFVYEKFLAYMNGMRVNVRKEGNTLQLLPFTEQQIQDLAPAVLKEPGLDIRGKDAKPEPEGIFDERKTGGMEGTRWSRFTLSEPVPNPLFEDAVKMLLGVNEAKFSALVAGDVAVNGKRGGPAIEEMLKKIDVKKERARVETRIAGARGEARNKLHRQLRILKALDDNKLDPTVYMMRSVPVIPPVFRPLTIKEDRTRSNADLNYLYKDLAEVSESLSALRASGTPEGLSAFRENRAAIYDGVAALMGMGSGGSLTRDYAGIADLIAGKQAKKGKGQKEGSPKLGYFQNQIVKRKQNFTGRSTIVPEPRMGLDELGLPEDIAWEIYTPFIQRELVGVGYKPADAQDQMKARSAVAEKALVRAMGQRPILLKRDPVLHKFNVMAFKPRLVKGKAIEIHPLVTSGYNADFDGDAMSVYLPVTPGATKEAASMYPSNNLFNPTTGHIQYTPGHESLLGLFLMSRPGQRKNLSFASEESALSAMRSGKIKTTDVVRVAGKETTSGRIQIEQALPQELLDKGKPGEWKAYDKRRVKTVLTAIAKNHGQEYGEVANKLKDLGNDYSYQIGFSIGLDDFAPVQTKERDRLVRKAEALVKSVNADTKLKPSEREAKIAKGLKAMGAALDKKVFGSFDKNPTNISLMVDSGSRGDRNQLKQIVSTPWLLMDARDRVVPQVVPKSYAEGMDLGSYWTTMHGARKGTIQKAQGTAKPGYLSKLLVNSTMDQLVTTQDCGTRSGVALKLDEEDVLDRHLAASVKLGGKTFQAGTVVTPDILAAARAQKLGALNVRSPLRCEADHGVCQKCLGLMAEGHPPDIGTNIGVIAANAIGEPSVQLSMKAFHGGGLATGGKESKSMSLFDELNKTLALYKTVPDAAPLSLSAGRVQSIRKAPQGGHEVTIGGVTQYVPEKLELKVKAKGLVKRGDPLSTGEIDPRQLLVLRGLQPVQDHITDKLKSILHEVAPVRRRNIEVVVKTLTNLARVEDSGDNPGATTGDLRTASQMRAWNAKHPGKKPVRYTPELSSIQQFPIDMQEDWIARLNANNLHRTLVEASREGWSSNISGFHPIPAVVHATTFGKSKDKLKEKWRGEY